MPNTLHKAAGLAAVLALASPMFAATALTVEPGVVKTTYCTPPKGDVTAWISFDVKYKNDLAWAVILPMPTRVAEYELFRDEEHVRVGRPLRRFAPRPSAMFDPSRIDPSRPADPTLFQVLQPDGVAQRVESLHLVVRGPKIRTALAGDYCLRVRIDPWPADRESGKVLAKAWEKRGKLWICGITLPIIQLHIEEPPAPSPCDLRVD
jgi:hypothetical protein